MSSNAEDYEAEETQPALTEVYPAPLTRFEKVSLVVSFVFLVALIFLALEMIWP